MSFHAFLVATLLLLALVPPIHGQPDKNNAGAEEAPARLWQVQEFSFRSQTSYSAQTKPWLAVDFSAEFTAEDGTTLTVPGFWDGADVFRIRFTPTLPGRWRYATQSKNDPSLAGRTGEFLVSRPDEAETNPLYRHGGFIRSVTPRQPDAPRYLTYTDGTPFFYLAGTLWYFPSEDLPIDQPAPRASLQKMGESFFRQRHIESALGYVLDRRREQGFSVIRAGMIGRNKLPDEIQKYYAKTGDIGLPYWQAADAYFRGCMERGLVVMLFPLWRGPSQGWPDFSQWKELMNYMMARFGAFPVIFGIGPEYNSPSKVAAGTARLALDVLAYTQSIDPWHRAQSIQPFPWNLQGKDEMEWNEPYVDFLMIEPGHEDPYGVSAGYYRKAWGHDQNGRFLPFVSVEATFDGIVRHGYPPHDDYVIRFNQYRAWMSGAKGIDYGTQGLWYPVKHWDDKMFEESWGKTNVPWWEAVHKVSADQMGYFRRLLENYPWWEARPLFDAIPPNEGILPPAKGQGKPPAREYRAAVACVMGGSRVFMVYIPMETSAEIPLAMSCAVPEGVHYRARWFDPRSGRFLPTEESVTSGLNRIDLPARPDTDDWALVLERESLPPPSKGKIPGASSGAFEQAGFPLSVAASASEPTDLHSLALAATTPSRSKLRGIRPKGK